MKKRKRLTKEQRLELHKKYNGHCAYCGREINITQMQADHIVPIHVGGLDAIENMNPACRSCNHAKATLDMEKFREWVETSYARVMKNPYFRIAINTGFVSVNEGHVKFYFEEDE